jgi:hypothetical protein
MKASILALLFSIATAAPVLQQRDGPFPPPGVIGGTLGAIAPVAGSLAPVVGTAGEVVNGVTHGLSNTVKGVAAGAAGMISLIHTVTVSHKGKLYVDMLRTNSV